MPSLHLIKELTLTELRRPNMSCAVNVENLGPSLQQPLIPPHTCSATVHVMSRLLLTFCSSPCAVCSALDVFSGGAEGGLARDEGAAAAAATLHFVGIHCSGGLASCCSRGSCECRHHRAASGSTGAAHRTGASSRGGAAAAAAAERTPDPTAGGSVQRPARLTGATGA